jgi:hypothetical protein
VLLNEAVAKADSAPDRVKDLSLDPPFQKVVQVGREVLSPSEMTVSDLLQQHEPPTIVQPQDQPPDQPKAAEAQDQHVSKIRLFEPPPDQPPDQYPGACSRGPDGSTPV